jgi:hypothetical protein
MNRLLFALTFFAFVAPAHGTARFEKVVSGTAVTGQQSTGIAAGTLNGGVTSTGINMAPSNRFGSTAMVWHIVVVPGTTTDVSVTCQESADNSTWHTLPFCSNEATSTCAQIKLKFPVSVGGINEWSFATSPMAQYTRCTFEDEASGSGTITVTGTRYAR